MIKLGFVPLIVLGGGRDELEGGCAGYRIKYRKKRARVPSHVEK